MPRLSPAPRLTPFPVSFTTFLFPPSPGQTATSARSELLAGWMERQFDGLAGHVETAADYQDLETRILGREAILAWAPPYVCAQVGHVAHAVFRAVRGGSDSYRAVVVSRNDEPLTLGDLHGKRAAWVAPRSEAGYRLPRKLMEDAGVDADRALASQHFAGSFGEALRWVLDGEADIAGVFARDATPEAIAESLEQTCGVRACRDLTPVAISAPIPNDALLLLRDDTQGGLSREELRDALKSTRSNMLLGVLDADRLELSSVDDYAALR